LKIAEVKKLDDGVNGIIIEGKIIKTPGKPRESQYGWSQMIVLKDETSDMSSWINIESAKDAYKVGQYIKVKGKVSHYVKDGKPGISLNNGNVIDEIVKDEEVSQEQRNAQFKAFHQPAQETTQSVEKTYPGKEITRAEYTNNDYWREKTAREVENNKCIVRECAIKAVTAMYAIPDEYHGKVFISTEKEYFEFADKIVDYIYQSQTKIEIIKPKITLVEEAIKEFGGTAAEEKPQDSGGRIYTGSVEKPKEQKIAQARELVKNPHLTEPVNDKMATIPQKKQIYGYINEEGKKIGGMVDSRYITEKEKEGIGDWKDLTKSRAFKMFEKWYGTKETLGVRDKRELEAKDKEQNPFLTERRPLETKDPNDGTPLTKDVLIDDIQALRKKLFLEDDVKFTKALGYNTNFEAWTEKELKKVRDLLKDWKPNWVK